MMNSNDVEMAEIDKFLDVLALNKMLVFGNVT